MRRLLQVIRSRMQVDGAVASAALHREVEFGRPQFHIVAPLRLWIKAERNAGQQIAAGRGVRQIKNVLRRRQALVCVRGIAGLIDVVAEAEHRSEPPRLVGADLRSRLDCRSAQCRRIHEHRTMTNVPVIRAASSVGVVRLRQPPDIMIADGLRIPIADRHLVIQDLIGVVPHFMQPIEAELRLIREVQTVLGHAGAGHLIGKVSNSDQHHGVGVRLGLDELHIVARIPPAA